MSFCPVCVSPPPQMTSVGTYAPMGNPRGYLIFMVMVTKILVDLVFILAFRLILNRILLETILPFIFLLPFERAHLTDTTDGVLINLWKNLIIF